MQSCQQSSDGTQGFNIASDGTEQMWIDTDGTVYLYYTGDENRLIHIIFLLFPSLTSHFFCRETRVNLHCDMTVKDPLVSTDGDSAVPLTYVRLNDYLNKSLILYIHSGLI